MNFSHFSKIQIIDVNLVSYYTYCVHILIHNIIVKTVSLVSVTKAMFLKCELLFMQNKFYKVIFTGGISLLVNAFVALTPQLYNWKV